MSHLQLAIAATAVLISRLFYMPLLQNTYSQIRKKNYEQLWTDSDHDLKIKFVYEPKNPIVDKPTELKFTVQRISTGDYVKDLEGNVLVTDNISGQFRNFKFNNISAPDGQFSVRYFVS